MKNNRRIKAITFGLCVISLAACSNPKEKLGLNKTAPDEFAVIKRAPLEIPEKLSYLPEPIPGATRPQETSPLIEARKTVLGKETAGNTKESSAENALLEKAGAIETDSGIRTLVNNEATDKSEKDVPVAKRIISWTPIGNKEDYSVIVNPEEESKRIKKTLEDGTSITEGKTPILD